MENFAERVAAQRPMLLRTARRMLRNPTWAEDAVSETMIAALEKPESFSGASALRTWLVAILKHKVVDQVRRHTRECQGASCEELDSEAGEPGIGDPVDTRSAVDPQERLSRLQFLTHLESCLQRLPPRQGRAFILKNGWGKDTDEICDELGISANNLSVMLHRAKRQLRASLQAAWAPMPGASAFAGYA
jgi:RNA polymerase sigma-70 factor, ECF subfamily